MHGLEYQRVVSISLSSGFSFQDDANLLSVKPSLFQSRYRAASHFRSMAME